MKIKDWLRQYRDIKKECEVYVFRIQKLREEAGRTTRPIKAVKTKGSSKDKEAVYAAILDVEQEMRERVRRLYALEREIERVIAGVGEGRLRTLLFLRYIEGQSWEKIAEALHYDYYYVIKKLHPMALSEAEKQRGL